MVLGSDEFRGSLQPFHGFSESSRVPILHAETDDGSDSPAYRFHRAPLKNEWAWSGSWLDEEPRPGDFYYLRVRQTNDQWAWASPVFAR